MHTHMHNSQLSHSYVAHPFDLWQFDIYGRTVFIRGSSMHYKCKDNITEASEEQEKVLKKKLGQKQEVYEFPRARQPYQQTAAIW